MTTPATPTREVISFGPFSLGRMPGRTKHAGFLHFGDTAVAPQRGHRQKRSDEPGLAGHYRAGRQPLLSHRKPSEGARRRTERRPLHHDGIGRGYCFVAPISRGEQRSRGWTSKIASTTPSASSPLSGPEVSDNAGGRNRAPADEFLRPLTDAAKERSDDQHAQRD